MAVVGNWKFQLYSGFELRCLDTKWFRICQHDTFLIFSLSRKLQQRSLSMRIKLETKRAAPVQCTRRGTYFQGGSVRARIRKAIAGETKVTERAMQERI